MPAEAKALARQGIRAMGRKPFGAATAHVMPFRPVRIADRSPQLLPMPHIKRQCA